MDKIQDIQAGPKGLAMRPADPVATACKDTMSAYDYQF
jgi:hypothetical protein